MPNYICHHCLNVFWAPFQAGNDGRLQTSCPNCKTGDFFAGVGPRTGPDPYDAGYEQGAADGEELGYANGYSEGSDEGKKEGESKGRELGFADGYKHGLEKLKWYEIQTAGNPQEPGDHLVFDIDYGVQRARFDRSEDVDGSILEGWTCGIDDIKPTHWADLPEPPTTETPEK